ncbi:MAG: permease [Candidatus Tectomicrobia bacterium]
MAFLSLCSSTALFIGKFIAVALLLEVILLRYLPAAWIETVLGANNPLSIPIAAAVGLPAYLNGNAAIPLLSGLLDLGMDRGAALAFLIAGPIASIPSLVGVMALVRIRAVVLILVAGFVGAVLSGYAFTTLAL